MGMVSSYAVYEVRGRDALEGVEIYAHDGKLVLRPLVNGIAQFDEAGAEVIREAIASAIVDLKASVTR
jgi:virulence-associated protein VagC